MTQMTQNDWKHSYDGKDIYGNTNVDNLRKNVGMVFQSQILFQKLFLRTLLMDYERYH
jgi:ABC-type phosphate transport system ATPase subunit